MAQLNKDFIVNLQGKDFVTYNGLMDLAHQMKLQSIKTEIIQIPSEENGNQCIVKAIATTEDGKVFEGFGDADPSNVNRMIAKHLIRMAETRAKARALRDLTNVGMTALEELSDQDDIEEDEELANTKQIDFIISLAKQKKYGFDNITKYMQKEFEKNSSKELTKQEASNLIKMLKNIGS